MTARALVALVALGCGGHPAMQGDAAGGGDATGTADANDGSTYAAYGIVGGLNRLRVAKTLASGATCFAIDLVQGGTQNSGLTLPSDWGFEMALALQPGAACNPAYAGPIGQSHQASSQSGTISWTGTGIPTSVDVHAMLVFANAPSWCPPSESLIATSVAVH